MKRIPIFALPDIVFFPRTFLPLHIFEARYRQMICNSLASERLVGMALLKEEWEKEYAGNPPIHPFGTIGKIVAVEPLPDGRYNIVLEGMERYQIVCEHSEKPYREGDVQIVAHPSEEHLPEPLRRELVRLLGEPAGQYAPSGAVISFLEAEPDDALLVNTLSYTLPLTVLEKQFLLEAESRVTQAKRLIDLIRFLRAREGGSPKSPLSGALGGGEK